MQPKDNSGAESNKNRPLFFVLFHVKHFLNVAAKFGDGCKPEQNTEQEKNAEILRWCEDYT